VNATAPRNPPVDAPTHVSIVPQILALCSVQAGGLLGLDFHAITVEVASRRGPSHFQLAGLAETAVREARIRISSALSQLGVSLDEYALTVNLAPANVRKTGTGLDLAIAVGILGAVGHLAPEALQDSFFVGEVALDGSVRGVPGVLPLLDGARSKGVTQAFVSRSNEAEAAQLRGLTVYAINSLSELIAHVKGTAPLPPLRTRTLKMNRYEGEPLEDVRGQVAAKRALMVAAAGHHHLLLVGPPGSGKSLLAKRLPSLLPPLDMQQALETTAVHSVAGILNGEEGIIDTPPFRAPHHTVSDAGLVGGGSTPRPGELSLAHHGVLFLDELPEYRRGSLEALRQPLEEHRVHIVRARAKATFPARPLVVGAMNPCPCGNWGNPRAACRCSPPVRLRYLSRISGPLLDRIDIHVLVPPVDLRSWGKQSRPADPMSTQRCRELVLRARRIQRQRFEMNQVSSAQNSQLTLSELEKIARPDTSGAALLEAAVEKNQLSARGYVRVLRIARTLADLDGEGTPGSHHIGEALRYRIRDLSDI